MKIIHQTTLLRTIDEGDIEQVRLWRNDEKVNHYLITKVSIGKLEQIRWFKSLDPSTSIYFMMEEAGTPFGVIYVHDIDLNEKSFWGSILTGNSAFLNTPMPVKSIMMIVELFFEYLLFESMYSKVHINNSAALQMDKRLGFKEITREGDFITSQCNKQNFNLYAFTLRKSLLKNLSLKLVIEKRDRKYPFLNNIPEQQF